MSDNTSSSLPQDAAKRLLELKKKILSGGNKATSPPNKSVPAEVVSSSKEILEPTTESQTISVEAVKQPQTTNEKSKKEPLTMKSLMKRNSSRRNSETATSPAPQPQPLAVEQQQPSIVEKPLVPTQQVVSRLKEAPAHRAALAKEDAVKPKVISLTKTWVTTTQEREAREASEEEQNVKKRLKVEQQPIEVEKLIVDRTVFSRNNYETFFKQHMDWINKIKDSLGEGETLVSSVASPFDRSDTVEFIRSHRQFIKNI